MNYTLLIYEAPSDFELRSHADPGKRAAYMAVWPPYAKALKEAGIYISSGGLQSPDTAACLRYKDDRRRVQDGPFADTKEQLGGFFVINVPDMDTALDWAARCPHGPNGIIEVRPNLIPVT